MPGAFDPASLDWNLLRALGAVLAHGSLTQAAQRLGTSQPTLSRQIAALEAQLGQPLFERTARRLKPTAAAQALAEPAQRMLAAAQALALAAEAPASQLAGTVRITASQVVSTQVLPAILAQLAEAHPEIQIELVPSDSLSNLLEREADIAVRMVRPTQGTLITRHLGDWPLGFYAHRRLIERAGGPPTPDDLTRGGRLRWVGFDQSSAMLDGFQAAGHAVDRRFFGFRCDDQVACLQAVRAGMGVGVVLQALASREPDLVPVLAELPLPVLPVWLTAHRELRASRRLRTVWEALDEGLRQWRDAAGPSGRPRADSSNG